MRSKLLTILLRKFREKDFLWILRQALKYFAIQLSYLLNKPLNGPILGVLLLTYRCNLRCMMCDLWRVPTNDKYANREELTTNDWKKVINDFADIGTTTIGFGGGEPLLRNDIFTLIGYAKQKGLSVQVSTNGFLLDVITAKQLLDSGVDMINISLDGIKAATHNKIRGDFQSHERAISAIKNISFLRREYKQHISLGVTCVISKFNLEEIIELVSFVIDLGADDISFMPVSDMMLLFDRESRASRFLVMDLKKVEDVVAQLIAIKKKTGQIDCSLKYLKLFNNAFARTKRPVRCYTGYTSCTVNPYGDIYPCFSFSVIAQPITNVLYTPLKEAWRSEKFNNIRRLIKNCRRCYWNCWTELSIMFDYF